LLRLNRLDEAEKSAREALLAQPNLAQAYLVLSDAMDRRKEYWSNCKIGSVFETGAERGESQSARGEEMVKGIIAKGESHE